MKYKKERMLRNKIDYDTNNVYIWKRRRNWNGMPQSNNGIKKNWNDGMTLLLLPIQNHHWIAHPLVVNWTGPLRFPPKNGGKRSRQNKQGGGCNTRNTGGNATGGENAGSEEQMRYPSQRQACRV